MGGSGGIGPAGAGTGKIRKMPALWNLPARKTLPLAKGPDNRQNRPRPNRNCASAICALRFPEPDDSDCRSRRGSARQRGLAMHKGFTPWLFAMGLTLLLVGGWALQHTCKRHGEAHAAARRQHEPR